MTLEIADQDAEELPLAGPGLVPVHALRVVAHPRLRQAVTTARDGMLARWEPDEAGVPRVMTRLSTRHLDIGPIAVSSDGALVAVAPAEGGPEMRAWDDLTFVESVPLPDPNGAGQVTAVALSSDGRWLASADMEEHVHLIERTTGRIAASVAGGEWTDCLAFDASSTLLASACSFQGGGHVRVDLVTPDGGIEPLRSLARSNDRTPPGEFVDSLEHLAFSADGRWLALYETSAIDHAEHPRGWRGNVVLYDLATGALGWQVSVDAARTGDERSLGDAGYPMGFVTAVAFFGTGEIVRGATRGKLIFFSVATGALSRVLTLESAEAIHSLSVSATGDEIWVVLGNGALNLVRL